MISAIIPAGGSGKRMGGRTPKQFLSLGNEPLLAHALRAFERAPSVTEVILVVPEAERDRALAEVVERYGLKKVTKVVPGGVTRQDSVRHGLREVDGRSDMVVVHDGVRPFVTEELIEASIDAARKHGGAIVAVPMKDTLKEVNVGGHILRTIDRAGFWLAQTPQTFTRALLTDAYRKADADDFHGTDEASLVEHLGQPVAVVQGRWDNIKVTTAEDLIMAEAILAVRAEVKH